MPITAVPRSGLASAITEPVRAMASIDRKKQLPARACDRPPLRPTSAAAPAIKATLPATTWMGMSGFMAAPCHLTAAKRIIHIVQLGP